ncbi:MAG: SLC13 family permease, partial [Deltaproteobacteria bacterium]|nr:SLC13 family permease [Deltaproteobacteria bacterium]
MEERGHPPQQYIIDQRRMHVIVLQKLYRPAVFMLMLGLLFLWHRTVRMAGLPRSGRDALGIFLVCAVLWIARIVPPAITGFTGIALLIVSRALTPGEVYPMFFSEPVFFILSAFALAAGMRKTGLAKRIAVRFISSGKGLPIRMRLYTMSAFLSMMMPEHAVAAMLIPVVLETGSGFTKGDLIGVMWGAQIGGIATLLGGARGPLTIAILKATKGIDISFLQWSIYALPVFLLIFVPGYFVLTMFFREESSRSLHMDRYPGVMRFEEIAMLIIMALTIIGWVKYGSSIGLAGVGLIAMTVLFLFGILKTEDLTRRIDWSVILMYGGAIAVGLALKKTGAAVWIGSRSTGIFSSGTLAIMLLSLTAVVMTEFVSHSTVVAALLPVALGVADTIGLEPRIMCMGLALASGMAFIFPFATP